MGFLITIAGIAHSNLNPTFIYYYYFCLSNNIKKCAIQNKLAYMYDFGEIFNCTFAHQLFEI